jgi:hypothetical protein
MNRLFNVFQNGIVSSANHYLKQTPEKKTGSGEDTKLNITKENWLGGPLILYFHR